MRKYEAPDKSVLNLALTIFGWSYLGWLLVVLVELRVGQSTPAHGILAIGTLILFVKTWRHGRLHGRPLDWPAQGYAGAKPGKTWEGVVRRRRLGDARCLGGRNILGATIDLRRRS